MFFAVEHPLLAQKHHGCGPEYDKGPDQHLERGTCAEGTEGGMNWKKHARVINGLIKEKKIIKKLFTEQRKKRMKTIPPEIIDAHIKSYLSYNGSKGGKKSHRIITPSQQRKMQRARRLKKHEKHI